MLFKINRIKRFLLCNYIAGWSSMVARRSLQPKVVGSSPTPATKTIGGGIKKRAFKSGKEFENKVKEYINWCDSKGRLANVAGFAVYADINQDTFYAQKEYYSESFKKVNDMLEDEALNNKYLNDTRIIFYMKNKCGYKDKQEIDTTSSNRIEIINDLPSDVDEDKQSDSTII